MSDNNYFVFHTIDGKVIVDEVSELELQKRIETEYYGENIRIHVVENIEDLGLSDYSQTVLVIKRETRNE